MGRDAEYPLSAELEANLVVLLERINKFRDIYDKPMRINSGYRPGHYNALAKGSPRSAHLTCQAVDIADGNGLLKEYIAENINILQTCDLYMEDPDRTPGWVHLDTRKRTNRVFRI